MPWAQSLPRHDTPSNPSQTVLTLGLNIQIYELMGSFLFKPAHTSKLLLTKLKAVKPISLSEVNVFYIEEITQRNKLRAFTCAGWVQSAGEVQK